MVKFFAVVRPYPTHGLVILALATGLGLWTTRMEARELDSGLGMVLMVQMFLASSGFATIARRGHYDPIFVRGGDRAPMLAVQWCASIAPGAIAWLVVSLSGYAWSSPAAWSALTGSRLAAFLIVSALAWAAGFALPRGAAGSLWMGLLVVLLLRHVSLIAPAGVQDSALAILGTAGAVFVCPFLVLGTHAQIGTPAMSAALCAAAALLLVTIRHGRRLDVFLVERS
jgi:hypothetical protein